MTVQISQQMEFKNALYSFFLKHPVPGDVEDRTLGLLGHQSDLLWQSPYFKWLEDMLIYTHHSNYVKVLSKPAANNIFLETLGSWIPLAKKQWDRSAVFHF